MRPHTSTVTGCGHAACACTGEPTAPARINGVALHRADERPSADALRERAYAELLRQEAVRAGLLSAFDTALAPELGAAERAVIEAMVERAVASPQPTPQEVQRYYEANPQQFMQGQAVHLRHILFAVTPGVNVHALTVRAEQALLELLGKDAPAQRFAELAAELSNCPSGAQGGDLGWVAPEDCAPELANELFQQKHAQWGLGVHPRLVHTRYGFHIIEVLERRKGKLASFDQVRESIAAQLALQSRARALHQYMLLLVGQAEVEGIDLGAAQTPLVQ